MCINIKFRQFVGLCISLIILTVNVQLAHAKSNKEHEVSSPKISVQLWSIKNDVKNDFKGTLSKLADMGFDGVEFAGDYGPYVNDAKGLKQFLNSLGLEASGAHVQTHLLKNDNSDKLLQFLSDLGAPYAIIPMDKRAGDPKKIDELAKDLHQFSEKLAKYKLKVGYHNHAFEFEDFETADGKLMTYWEYLTAKTPEDVVMQMDIGWSNLAGKDASTIIKAYPNRTLTTHIKIRTEGSTGVNTIIGSDNFDWSKLIADMRKHGGTQWLVVEQEEYPEGYTPISAVEASKKGLQKSLAKSEKWINK
ncbi:sugar phosphate isomerase/epimerase family protein [Agaribacter flavus]|uniref:Sugar phosphate isomerase/epimerase family protein n=1 Tax=Agaribacter flavus TaxID=1902781 RepID=A0ABV7FPL3_9ALTE